MTIFAIILLGRVYLKFTEAASERLFLWPNTLDEEEYTDFLKAIDRLDTRFLVRENDSYVLEQLRDEDGYRVPGCHMTTKAPTYG